MGHSSQRYDSRNLKILTCSTASSDDLGKTDTYQQAPPVHHPEPAEPTKAFLAPSPVYHAVSPERSHQNALGRFAMRIMLSSEWGGGADKIAPQLFETAVMRRRRGNEEPKSINSLKLGVNNKVPRSKVPVQVAKSPSETPST